MAYRAHPAKSVVFKARRDTIALVVGATAATFALSYSIHARPEHGIAAPRQQDWTGQLAEIAPVAPTTVAPDTITSASLVVPSSELALPTMPVRPLVRLRGCEDSNCVARSTPTPARRPITLSESSARPLHRGIERGKPTLMSRMNPLNHLPDMNDISRPFAYAGDTVTSWFKRF